MATERKEFDLIIKAAVQGGKSVDDIVKSIDKLENSLDSLVGAAQRGDAALDELRATQLALKDVQNQLANQSRLLSMFNKLATDITKAEAKLASATQKFEEYQQKVTKAGAVTEVQAEKINKLGAAVERNQTLLTKNLSDYQSLGDALRELGINTDDLAGSQNRINQEHLRTVSATQAVNSAITGYADNVRKARDAQKQLADEQAFQRKLDDAAKLNKASEYVLFWTRALEKADLAEQQTELNAALRRTADSAIAAARGYQTLGTAARSLQSTTTSLSSTINSIISPRAASLNSQGGIEQEVARLASSIAAIKGPISDYRAQLAQIAEVQRRIVTQSNLVDQYRKQVQVLREARTEFANNRAQVIQYAEALRAGGVANDELEAKLRAAQTAQASSFRNLQTQLNAARELRAGMREAGLATNDLAATQGRLTTAARTTVTAMNSLAEAHRKYGAELRNNNRDTNVFGSSGRTTLSLLQRIRGEVLSLVAAYAGLYGAIGGAGAAIDAFNGRQQTQNRLAIAVGDNARLIGQEYQYIHDQADRIGLDFEKTSDAYSRFAVAATAAGASVEEVRFIFESFGEAGTVLGVNGDRMRLIFSALEQMMSKGRITAEELRQQLGESLPGAFQLFQEAVQDRFPDLNAALKEGLITAAEILPFAQRYRDLVAGRLPAAMESLIAQQNRFNNALFDFKLAVADSGFIDGFTGLLKDASSFLRSDEGERFAQALATAFSFVAEIMGNLLRNLDEVIVAIKIIAVTYGIKTFAGLALSAIEASKQVNTLTASLSATDKMMGILRGTFLLLQAATIGWTIGTFLRTQFQEARLAGIALVIGLQSLFTRMKFTVQAIFAEIPGILSNALALAGNAATKVFREILSGLAVVARSLGKDELANTLDRATEALTFGVRRTGDEYRRIMTEMEADLARIKQIGEDMVDAELAAEEERQRASGSTANPGESGVQGPPSTEDAEKRLALKQQIEAELASVNAKIERQEKESLESRLAAIDSTYFTLLRKIRTLGGAEAAAFSAQLASDIAKLKIQETRKFNEELADEQQALQRKLEQIDAQSGRAQKTDLDARLQAVRLSHEETYRDIADFRDRLLADGRDTAPADALKERLDLGVRELQILEQHKFYEDAINSALEGRKARLDTIRLLEENGLITATEAREQAAAVVTDTQPHIEALVEDGLAFVDVMIASAEAIGANTAALEVLRAKLIEARESANGITTDLLSAAQANEMIADGAVDAFDKIARSIGNAAVGLESWRDVLGSVRNAFLQFAADFLLEIGKMILRQQLLNALQNSSFGGALSGFVTGAVRHAGGLAGGPGPSRLVPISVFANAPRYHGGGLAGLRPNEVPAILERNEEIVTAADPRHVANGGGVKGDTNIYNMIDANELASAVFASPVANQAIVNIIRSNSKNVKTVLG